MVPDNQPDDNSLLTATFREFLETKPEPNSYVRKLRSRMRDRVKLGINDFNYLNLEMRDDDIAQIFEEQAIWQGTKEQVKEYGQDHLEEGQLIEPPERGYQAPWPVAVRHMIEFVYKGLRANNVEPDEFVEMVRRSIHAGEADHLEIDPDSLEIELELTKEVHRDYDDMDPVEKVEHGLRLSGDEWGELTDRLVEELGKDAVLGENIPDLVREHLLDDQPK